MFSVDQLTYFEESNENLKYIKSSWDVAAEYVAKALLLTAFLSGVMQVTMKADFACVPVVECNPSLSPSSQTNRHCTGYYKNSPSDKSTKVVMVKLQDRRQYDFAESKCKRIAVEEFASSWPFILFVQAIAIFFLDSLCTRLPLTASKIDSFLSLVVQCQKISGTNSAISDVLWNKRANAGASQSKTESKDGDDKKGENRHESDNPNATGPVTEFNTLEKSEAIKVMALREKVNRFRNHVKESKTIKIHNMQCCQRILGSIAALGFFVLNSYFYHHFKEEVICPINDPIFEDYNYFRCENGLIAYFSITFIVSCVLFMLYIMFSLILFSIFFYSIKGKKMQSGNLLKPEINDEDKAKVPDDPDVTGDMAFMLHLLEKCNEMYFLRFALFIAKENAETITYKF